MRTRKLSSTIAQSYRQALSTGFWLAWLQLELGPTSKQESQTPEDHEKRYPVLLVCAVVVLGLV